MEWREVGPYRDAMIWVRELRAGCWLAAVAPMPALAEKQPALSAPSEEMILPAGFVSQVGAIGGAQRCVDREREGPLQQGGNPDEGAALRPQHPLPGVRQFARFPVSLPVLVRADQFPGRDITGRVRNVGAGGLMAELPVRMEEGSAVAIFLQTRQGPRELGVRVVWIAAVGEAVRHGCSFSTPESLDFAVELFVQQAG